MTRIDKIATVPGTVPNTRTGVGARTATYLMVIGLIAALALAFAVVLALRPDAPVAPAAPAAAAEELVDGWFPAIDAANRAAIAADAPALTDGWSSYLLTEEPPLTDGWAAALLKPEPQLTDGWATRYLVSDQD